MKELLESLLGSTILNARVEGGDVYLELNDSRVVVFVNVHAMGTVATDGVLH